MLKVKYPQLTNLEDKYVKYLDFSNNMHNHFNDLKISNTNSLILNDVTLDDICKMKFEKIIKEFESYKQITGADDFLKLFTYDDFQPKIKTFFETYFDLRVCYYCGIDFINSFTLLHDFHDENDFLRRATKEQLLMINGIGESYAMKIISWRASNELDNVRANILENIKFRKVNKEFSKSLFTLDHVLDKANNPFFALSLYNFVPSCYACNSKFKHAKQLVRTSNDKILSPTYDKFRFHDDVTFKVVFYNGKNIDSVTSINDFIIEIDDISNRYKNYIEILHLLERHLFYKKDVLQLLMKIQRYTDAYMQLIISTSYGIKANDVLLNSYLLSLKKHIFGVEIFDGELDAKPLTKIKRDIAKQFGCFHPTPQKCKILKPSFLQT